MQYFRFDNRPEILVDQLGTALVDPQGNFVGWDGPMLTGNLGNLSTLLRGRSVVATKAQDTRRL